MLSLVAKLESLELLIANLITGNDSSIHFYLRNVFLISSLPDAGNEACSNFTTSSIFSKAFLALDVLWFTIYNLFHIISSAIRLIFYIQFYPKHFKNEINLDCT